MLFQNSTQPHEENPETYMVKYFQKKIFLERKKLNFVDKIGFLCYIIYVIWPTKNNLSYISLRGIKRHSHLLKFHLRSKNP